MNTIDYDDRPHVKYHEARRHEWSVLRFWRETLAETGDRPVMAKIDLLVFARN